MKRWAILTVLLYALALLLLTVPIGLAAFANWGVNNMQVGLRELIAFYTDWQYWLWLGILVAGQFLLLLLPIHLAERRLPARRPLKIPVIVTAFFLACLFVAGLTSVLLVLFKDEGFQLFSLVDRIANAMQNKPANISTDWGNWTSAILVTAIFWLVWGVVFHRFARADDGETLLNRITRWLLRGSILELLIAVPSHVIVRRRDDCCAPIGTFWGIATGISVMLLCFGPGVFFLFVKRMKRLQAKNNFANPSAK
jgi:hypothetical protein